MAMDKKGKVRKVMGEFKDGKLQSGSGHKVTNRNQAMAIALKKAGINRKMFPGGRIGDGKAVQGNTRGRII
jgi:Zn-dependent metalloprotease